jgi:hypothetical protein
MNCTSEGRLLGARPTSSFSTSSLPRRRWNVVDLLTIFGGDSVPSYLFCDIDVSWAENLMAKFADKGIRMTITTLLIKAISLAQKKHPFSRTIVLSWGKRFTLSNIKAGFTVERVVDGEPAVFFGAIDNPIEKSLEQIAVELNQHNASDIGSVPQLSLENQFSRVPWFVRQIILWLAKGNPSLRLKFLGATFGPCVCSTFGVGTVERRPVVENNQVVIKPMLTLSLVFDYRVMDNCSANRFLSDVRKLMEGKMESEL